MRGGFGLAVREGDGCAAAAMVAVNAYGDVRDAAGAIIAGARRSAGGFIDTARAIAAGELASQGTARGGGHFAPNTTLAVIALDAAFTRLELQGIARAATAAYHRRITPAGTQVDGDIVFALAPMEGPRGSVAQGEMLAVAALEEAIERAVRLARGRDGVPGLAD
jgi:L-aminopeptidase/D-esterase-like protein